jgi:DNA processing protein
MDANDSRAWAALTRAPGLSAASLSAALDQLGGLDALLRGSDADRERAGLSAGARGFLGSPESAVRSVERAWLDHDHHHLVPMTHPRYPRQLALLEDRPIALYVSGRIEALDEPQLAIVGSRSPTPQGRENSRAFAAALCERGLAVGSGLAEGVDACAHRGALDVQGVTLAVLGSGIDIVYPNCNAALFAEIDRFGALISEFALSTPPRRENFPRRNRLIAGLSLGTLVIEAARRSGSLITARWAASYGREVFALPGSIHNPLSRGCHELIKSGAKLTETTADILRELNFSAFFANDLHDPGMNPSPGRDVAGMDKAHKILLDALGFDPVDLDTMVVRTGFKPEVVSSTMLILELEGHVQAAPGGRYFRVGYRRAGGER